MVRSPESDNPQCTHWAMTYFFQNQDPEGDEARQEEQRQLIERIDKLGLSYLVAGMEVCPQTGRIHLQISFISTARYRQSQMFAFFPGIHVRAMRKAPWINAKYCKKDGSFFEIGQLPAGYDNDKEASNLRYKDIIRLAKEGKLEEIAEKYPGDYIRQYRTLRTISDDNWTFVPTGRKINIWLYSRNYFVVGKSTWLTKYFLLNRTQNYWHPMWKESNFWQLYESQSICIFDDLDEENYNLGGILKRITSTNVPVIANKKHSCVVPKIKVVFVTSNYLPEEIWKNKIGEAIHARFKVFKGIRHCDDDILVSPEGATNDMFPVSFNHIIKDLGINLIRNDCTF